MTYKKVTIYTTAMGWECDYPACNKTTTDSEEANKWWSVVAPDGETRHFCNVYHLAFWARAAPHDAP